jgi:hypothetical protein
MAHHILTVAHGTTLSNRAKVLRPWVAMAMVDTARGVAEGRVRELLKIGNGRALMEFLSRSKAKASTLTQFMETELKERFRIPML